MLETKPTHVKGWVTFNVNKFITRYRKEVQWVYDINVMTWLDINYNDEDPLILHDVAKSPMPSTNTY